MPQRLEWTIDVNAPLSTIQTPTLLMQGDDQANTFAVRVTDKGENYDLSGYTVSAWVERRDGVRVPMDGRVEGNLAEVTLTESCYRVSGRYIAFMRITNADTGEKRTVLRLTGMIESEGNGPVLDEEDMIPSLEELLAQIAAMEKATASAATATSAANTAAANANTVARTVQDALDSGALVGQGLQVLGYYETADALAAAVTAPEAGDAYGVGTAEPYDIYVWDAVSKSWINNGAIQGPQGERGPQGVPGTDAKRNLLDNSDFRNPVNQRGASSQSTSGQYFIDRWMVENSGGLGTASIDDDGLTLQSGASGYIGIIQRIPIKRVKLLKGKPVTMAYGDADGNVYAQAVTAGAGSTKIGALNIYSTAFADNYAAFYFRLTSPSTMVKILWVALYEGEYTAETLPEYICKGYATELAECRGYYYALSTADSTVQGTVLSASMVRFIIPLPMPMRTKPTATMGGIAWVRHNGMTVAPTAFNVSSLSANPGQIELNVNVTADGLTAYHNCTAGLSGVLSFSADL